MSASALQRAIALHQAGNLAAAEAAYRAVLVVDPNNFNAVHLLGVLRHHQGRPQEAVGLIAAALRLDPGVADAHGNLGNALRALGQLDAAAASYRVALRLAPDLGELHFGLGQVLREQQRLAEAVRHFQQARQLKPELPEAALHICNDLATQRQFAAAEILLRDMVERDPLDVSAWINLGNVLMQQARYPASLDCYRRAQVIDPNCALAHYNEGLVLLLTGDFGQGWQKYEWRWALKGYNERSPQFNRPRWNGEELGDRTLLLYGDQGLGDIIQFSRYVPLAAKRARILFWVPPALMRLLSSLPGGFEMLRPGQPVPEFDRHCALSRLPGVFGTNAATIPAPIPYLAAEPARVAAWAARLPATGRRIGIVWQGNPEAAADRQRSLPLACFEAVARVPGVTLVSLQYGAGLEQVEAIQDRVPVFRPGPDFNSGPDAFLDTAAVIMNLDLVISVDTAAVHLAGALGKPVWLLNRFDTCWRWLLEREDSPWYPSLRQFRQRRSGDWAEVLERVAAALPEFLSGSTSRSG